MNQSQQMNETLGMGEVGVKDMRPGIEAAIKAANGDVATFLKGVSAVVAEKLQHDKPRMNKVLDLLDKASKAAKGKPGKGLSPNSNLGK